MRMGASASLPAAVVMRIQSLVSRKPPRSFIESTRASEHRRRSHSDSFDISSENTSAGNGWRSLPSGSLRFCMAALTTMFMTNDVLPIDGRAAMMMRSPGCSPAVIASSLW